MSRAEPTRPRGSLTIGEVARLAGVTPRAIRHYQSMGLLPEPARDASGYRRYDAEAVVAVVRVVRLRAVGMPIAQIAEQAGSLAGSLTALAAELAAEIDRLTALLDRIHELVRSGAHQPPDAALLEALQRGGVVAPGGELPPAEVVAAELVDALHPRGMAGLLDQAHDLLADPELAERIGPLLQRFRSLDADSADADLDRLAADFAAALPRPADAPPPVDIDLMDHLLGDRLTPVQRRFMRRLRVAMDPTDD